MATALLEVTLSWLLANAKGRDARSFYTRAAFAEHAGQQTVAVASPECGPSGARLDAVKHLAGGGGNFPALEWSAPPELATAVREWLLVCEDVDVPLPAPVTHGCVSSRFILFMQFPLTPILFFYPLGLNLYHERLREIFYSFQGF